VRSRDAFDLCLSAPPTSVPSIERILRKAPGLWTIDDGFKRASKYSAQERRRVPVQLSPRAQKPPARSVCPLLSWDRDQRRLQATGYVTGGIPPTTVRLGVQQQAQLRPFQFSRNSANLRRHIALSASAFATLRSCSPNRPHRTLGFESPRHLFPPYSAEFQVRTRARLIHHVV